MKQFDIKFSEDINIQAYKWLPENNVIAIIQIVHGMQEHAQRYDAFARWLNVRGIAVYAEDHIGHGASVRSMEEISHFPHKHDWDRSIGIIHRLMLKIKAEHPNVPVFLLGHSMGSVLTQTLMMRHGDQATGYILSGAIRHPLIMTWAGRVLARVLSLLSGPANRSKLIISLGYGKYNKHFRPNRTGADWLCSNDDIVDEYIASPLCGIPLTNMFYRNFFYGLNCIACNTNLRKIPAGKPVFVVAGENDPAGFFGKAPLKIKQNLVKYARAQVDLKLYPGFRHEILNETNREIVFEDIFAWVSKNILR